MNLKNGQIWVGIVLLAALVLVLTNPTPLLVIVGALQSIAITVLAVVATIYLLKRL